ncbi:MAG: helix-turn-helix transcriptional regulator, partial [Ktedonobacteraceae bacterium]|nr:helix-turn-helix transcriptional regulator [Ktedonobacteraceae bacterium]
MNRIKELRESQGMTQQELANEAAIGRNTLSLYESSTYSKKIKASVQERIATALKQPISVVFPANGEGMNRRDVITGMATIGVGVLGTSLLGQFIPFRSAIKLSETDLQELIDANFATWQLLEGVQRGVTLDYINSIAIGKLVTLNHLAQHALQAKQQRLIRVLEGDMHILLGRLQRDTMNYGTAEAHFQQAINIAQEIESADLETAARHRLGNMMLLDQHRMVAAVQNAHVLLDVSTKASHPLWAEAQLMAGAAYAYSGRYSDYQRLATTAKEKTGRDPSIWVGGIGNPPAIYADMALITSLATGRYIEAYEASVEAVEMINRDYPDNAHWRLNVEAMQAQALWELGDIEGGAKNATRCLISARLIGNTAGEARLESLHT